MTTPDQPRAEDVEAGAHALFQSDMRFVSKKRSLDEFPKLENIYRRKARVVIDALSQPSERDAVVEKCLETICEYSETLGDVQRAIFCRDHAVHILKALRQLKGQDDG